MTMFIYTAAPCRTTKITSDERAPGPCEAGNDPRQFPILSRHWGDLHPAEIVSDLRFRRQVERILALGPRPIIELLIEIGEQRLCRTYLEQRVQRYAEIDPEHLVTLGGDTFPRPPLYGIEP